MCKQCALCELQVRVVSTAQVSDIYNTHQNLHIHFEAYVGLASSDAKKEHNHHRVR